MKRSETSSSKTFIRRLTPNDTVQPENIFNHVTTQNIDPGLKKFVRQGWCQVKYASYQPCGVVMQLGRSYHPWLYNHSLNLSCVTDRGIPHAAYSNTKNGWFEICIKRYCYNAQKITGVKILFGDNLWSHIMITISKSHNQNHLAGTENRLYLHRQNSK